MSNESLLERIKDHRKLCESVRLELPNGPWSTEPDRFETTRQGLHCLMLRAPATFTWCGYVGLPPSHPYYKKEYDDVPVSAHGGLTYSAFCADHICHPADQENETEKLWWVGFDCGHFGDYCPGIEMFIKKSTLNRSPSIYRDFNDVLDQTYALADQLVEVK